MIEMKREDEGADFKPLTTFDHPYPATKVMWSPTSYTGSTNELLATTGDYLRIWSYDQEKKHVELKSLLNNNRHTGIAHILSTVFRLTTNLDYCAPLTSFDWSDEDPSMLGTCSIDTTCTMWDVTVRDPAQCIVCSCVVFRNCVPRRNSSLMIRKCMTLRLQLEGRMCLEPLAQMDQ